MPIPSRILRAQADALPGEHPQFTAHGLAVQDRILKVAAALATRHGCAGLTIASVAAALRMAPATLRRHFCDLDTIIAEIFVRHLRAVSDAIGNISCNSADLYVARRAAYAAATRDYYGGFTDLHALFLNERHRLPPDLAEPLETFHATLGHLLGAAGGVTAINLLDARGLELPQIETILAALAPIETTTSPEPAAEPVQIGAPPFRSQPALPEKPAPKATHVPSPPFRHQVLAPEAPVRNAREGPEESLAHMLKALATRRFAIAT
jgi:AcrR family transcriptional regulator